MGGTCRTRGEKSSVYILLPKLQRKRSFGRAGHKWEGNIEVGL
jgi:hypothetical protein